MTASVIGVVIATVIVGALALMVVGLLRSHGEILRAIATIDDREPSPALAPARPDGIDEAVRADDGAFDIVGLSPSGQSMHVSIAGAPHATLLAFLSTSCGTCLHLWHELAAAGDVPGGARLVIVTRDPATDDPSAVRAVAPPDVAVVQSTAAWTAYGVPDAPYFVLVDGPGARIVGEGAAPAWDHVRNLMQNALADAGVVARSATPAHPRRARQTGRDRADRVNADLLAAGIGPDHPSLRPPARRVE